MIAFPYDGNFSRQTTDIEVEDELVTIASLDYSFRLIFPTALDVRESWNASSFGLPKPEDEDEALIVFGQDSAAEEASAAQAIEIIKNSPGRVSMTSIYLDLHSFSWQSGGFNRRRPTTNNVLGIEFELFKPGLIALLLKEAGTAPVGKNSKKIVAAASKLLVERFAA